MAKKIKAFVSCSLRVDDQPFIDFIFRILEGYNIEPFGTLVKYAASPENPVALMNTTIPIEWID